MNYIEKYEICRMRLIEEYSNINSINYNIINIHNVFDWLEEIETKYGKEIYITKDSKDYNFEIENLNNIKI